MTHPHHFLPSQFTKTRYAKIAFVHLSKTDSYLQWTTTSRTRTWTPWCQWSSQWWSWAWTQLGTSAWQRSPRTPWCWQPPRLLLTPLPSCSRSPWSTSSWSSCSARRRRGRSRSQKCTQGRTSSSWWSRSTQSSCCQRQRSTAAGSSSASKRCSSSSTWSGPEEDPVYVHLDDGGVLQGRDGDVYNDPDNIVEDGEVLDVERKSLVFHIDKLDPNGLTCHAVHLSERVQEGLVSVGLQPIHLHHTTHLSHVWAVEAWL